MSAYKGRTQKSELCNRVIPCWIHYKSHSCNPYRHSEKIPLLEEKHLQLVVNNSAQLLGYHILLPAEAILLGGSAADMHEAQHESDDRWTTDFLGVPRTPTERARELKKKFKSNSETELVWILSLSKNKKSYWTFRSIGDAEKKQLERKVHYFTVSLNTILSLT